MQNHQLILIRHGESEWNKLNKFTGWTDVKLTKNGQQEAKLAGQLLKKNNIKFDCCYTSVLTRAIHTLWIILNELNQVWLPVKKTWRLNERHYGNLQGLNKDDITIKYGKNKVNEWRRSFEAIPPALSKNDNLIFYNDPRYKSLTHHDIPTSESLKLTLLRVMPLWEKNILLDIKKNKKILIVAHGNSLRALMKYLSNLNDQEISEINLPTGIPIIYSVNNMISLPIKYFFLKNK